MKKLIAAAIVSLVAFPAVTWSQKPSTPLAEQRVQGLKSNYMAICDRLATIAGAIMDMRQDNVEFATALKIVHHRVGGPEFEHLVIEAYETPFLRRVQPLTADTVRDFSNKWGRVCTKALRE